MLFKSGVVRLAEVITRLAKAVNFELGVNGQEHTLCWKKMLETLRTK